MTGALEGPYFRQAEQSPPAQPAHPEARLTDPLFATNGENNLATRELSQPGHLTSSCGLRTRISNFVLQSLHLNSNMGTGLPSHN